MISLAVVLSGKPILVKDSIYFYQPTIQEIAEMGEGVYWSALNLWTLTRKQLIANETEETLAMDDFEVWKAYVFDTPAFRRSLIISCRIFLKTKIEFFDISHTMYIGERESGVILDNTFYLLMRELCLRIVPEASSASESNAQYKENEHMSERERQLIEKMKKAEKQIEETKAGPPVKAEDYLGNKILGLVAVGTYTFEQVYNMTMLQFNMLLKKYVDIQSFELRTILSPYMSSEDGQGNKFWLD